jgi:protocatechuate 3,4-dioxygenase beta subunit
VAAQARALVVLGGLLAVGIGAAVWLTTAGGSPDSGVAVETSASRDEPAKPNVAGAKRPKPKGSASVVGEVRRSKGRAPVADQEVQLVPEKGDSWTVLTDARGAFRLTEIPHGGPYELRVAATGCGTIRIPGMALDRGEKRDVGTLWLDPAVRVTVQVRAWSDDPVAGALVEAYAVPAADNFDWSKAMAQMGQTPVAVAKATTDEKGEASFAELAVGRWTFAATKTGFGRAGRTTSLRSDVPTPPVKLYLGTGHPLTGRVFDSAKNPVAGAQVLAGPAGSPWDLGASALRSRTTTDDQGRYQFASLESGDAQLMVSRAGGIPGAVATLKIPNVQQFDVYLKGAATVTGTVTEKDGGKPVEGATVRAFSNATGGSAAPSEAATDAEGKYTLVVSAGAVSQIAAEKEGFASADDPMRQQQPLQIREGETQSRDLKLRPGCKVAGVVKGPDGPVCAAKVMVTAGSTDRGWSTKTASTDSEGKYEVGSLIPGKAIVRADAAGFFVKDFPENYWMILQSNAPSPFKLDVAEGQTAVKDLEMVRGSVLEGRVDGPDGPLAGVRVSLPQDFEGGVVTGADGAFRIEGAKPAQTVVPQLAKEGYAPATSNKPLAVTADQPTTGVVLKMTRVLVVKGVVSAADGAPIRDGKVSAFSWSDRSDGGGVSPMMYGGGSGGSSTSAPIHADGTFEVALAGTAGNKVRVTATALDHPSATSEPATVADGQTECVVNVNLDGGKDVEGKVVEKQGGAAVAGAQISIQTRTPRGGVSTATMPQMVDGGFYSRGGGQTVWAVTDSEGRFAIGHLAPGTYAFTARADGYVAGSATVDLASAATVTVEIEPELSIEGVVTMQDGSPVEGASVGAARDAPASAEPRSTTSSFTPMGGMGVGATTTGVGGWFRVTGLSGGAYRLTVGGGRQGDLNIRTKKTELIAAGAKDVKIVVDAGGTIAGRVLDPQKRGASGIWIYANPEQNNGKPVAGAEGRQTRTKEDGTFTVVGLADVTTYAINVQSSQGWDMAGGSTWKNATLKNVAVGTNNVEIALEEGLAISGVVVDGEGKPVANSYLFCTMSSADGKSRQTRNAMTDAGGAFTVGGLDPGDCSFTLQPGMNGALVLQNGDKVAAGSRDVRLVATKGLTITGTVVDESGAPVKSATLNASAKTGGRGGYAQSHDDGTFEIGGLATGGVYAITATASGRARGRLEDVAAGASAVRIVVPKGLEASGRVLDDKGSPVKGGQIFVHLTSDPNQSQAASIDESGNFTLHGLGEGTYEARAISKSAADHNYHSCGTLKAGDAGVELRMEP